MELSDFDYDLPAELIAQEPAKQRDQSRLLHVGRGEASLSHHRFPDLLGLLPKDCVLVCNNTRVIPARLRGKKTTGGKAELLLVRRTAAEGEVWQVLCKGGRPAKANVAAARKSLGRIHGFAVRFGEPAAASTLLVGEGIETVLSLVTVLPHGVLRTAGPSPTFAASALSAGGLGTFVPPPMVSRLIVAQDRDEEGECAARRLQLRCTRLGIASAVLVPDGGDFNNDLVDLGPDRLASQVAPLLNQPPKHNRCGFAADEERKNGGPK